MAELNVQPKKKSSVIAWILLGLGVIALIWYLTRKKDDNRETVTNISVPAQGARQLADATVTTWKNSGAAVAGAKRSAADTAA